RAATRALRPAHRQGETPARRDRAAPARRAAQSFPRREARVKAMELHAPAAILPEENPRPSALRELWNFRQLISVLVVRELKVRYKRSVLGLLWTMLNPLLLMVVYTVVFSTIWRSSFRNFSLFLLSGLL